MSISIAKVTDANIGKTPGGHSIFQIKLNNSFWATKLFPVRKTDKKHDDLFTRYEDEGSLDFLIGKWIEVIIEKTRFGYNFSLISDFDIVNNFQRNLLEHKGLPFFTKANVYDLLILNGRQPCADGSIKINSDFGDLRVKKVDSGFRVNSGCICYTYDDSLERLNFFNIEKVFDKFYKDVELPAHSPQDRGDKSYYKISYTSPGIVRMDNHVRISYKATTSGDHDYWTETKVISVGDSLPEEQADYLKNTL